MNYSIKELDAMTQLVTTIRINLMDKQCSFDEACEVTEVIFDKLNNDEIQVDDSLKLLIPNFLEQVRTAE